MSFLLCIESALEVCSVSISHDEKLLSLVEEKGTNLHASLLGVFIEKVLNDAHVDRKELSAIVVSAGPGSYTGLRIGVSAAKGLAYGLDIPLISINTLLALSRGAFLKRSVSEDPAHTFDFLIPMIDARRMEVYSAVFNADGLEQEETKAEILTSNSYLNFLNKGKVLFFGNGMPKAKELLSEHSNAFFMEDINPSSRFLIKDGINKFHTKDFENIYSYEPFYLKEFRAGG